jgi:predicted nucleic acid-binding protein
MRLVVADTSPIFYLLSIGQIELLPRLFKTVFVPDAVHTERSHPTAPPVLREWIAERPSWLEVMQVDLIDDAALQPLGAGDRAAITLALSMRADLILIDERKGTSVAITKGFTVTGTLGILWLAAKGGLIDVADTLAKLKRTNFRYRQEEVADNGAGSNWRIHLPATAPSPPSVMPSSGQIHIMFNAPPSASV